jgi:transcriptional regulator
MYIPDHFVESDLNRLHEFIEQNSFGVLVSQVDGSPFATHLPLLLERDSGPYGTLVGHTARANPQCAAAGDQAVLAIFSGPHAYISPSWYEAENVVPTWNYIAVHASGRLRIIEDEPNLSSIVQRMTEIYERSMPRPWSFDGSTRFAERLLSQIIGFRIEIEQIEGKWKMSQNQTTERQAKVVAALHERSDPNSQAVAEIIDARLK